MGLINFGAGLSAMGQAVANTAGAQALEQQKADLEAQQTQLANQLAGERETKIEGMREGSAEKIAGQQITSSEKIATGQQQTSRDIAAGEQATQLKVASIEAGVQNKEVSIDTTGNAIVVDKSTGKVTPILGKDGQPIQLPNPAMAQVSISTINQANEELRNLDLQYNNELSSARTAYNDAVSMSGGDVNSDKAKAARANIDSITAKYQPAIDSIHARIEQATSAMLNKPATTKSGVINRPPLGSFLKPPGQSAPGP